MRWRMIPNINQQSFHIYQAKKLKYKPTVRDGRAVAVEDVPHKFTYEIEENS